MLASIDQWLLGHGTSLLELAGFVTGVAYVWLVIGQRLLAWPIGLANALAYAVLFRAAGLYSDAGLQIGYAALCLYGWWHWRGGGASRGALPVTRTPRREAVLVAVAVLAGWGLLYAVTARLPGTSLPAADAALVAGSLAGQWLTTRKRLGTWGTWLVVNAGYVALFLVKGLVLTAVLYGVYWLLALRGHAAWRRALATASARP